LSELSGRDVISIVDFSRSELDLIMDEAERLKGKRTEDLKGRIMATAFFEPSTRTRLSFQTAMLRLGGSVIGFSSEEGTSVEKGESFSDTIRMLDNYSDIIVVRHRLEGAAKLAAELADAPVINAGDGSKNHPTQAMLDLFTIRETFGHIDGLNIGVLGDLRFGRAASSFILGASKYNVKLFLISPPELRARKDVIAHLKNTNTKFSEVERLEEVIGELDVIYVTRVQKERFADPAEYEKVRGSYKITAKMLSNAKKEAIVMHPLPRVDEIDISVDSTPHAAYFRQAANGVPVRMALLKLILGD